MLQGLPDVPYLTAVLMVLIMSIYLPDNPVA